MFSQTKSSQIVLSILGLSFALVAILGLFVPRILFSQVEIAFNGPAALAEIRAAYGGLFGIVAILFFAGVYKPVFRKVALWCGVLVLGGFAVGRVFSLFVDGVPNTAAWAAFFIEGTALLACGILYRLETRSEERLSSLNSSVK